MIGRRARRLPDRIGSVDLVALLEITRRELDRVDHKAELVFTASGVVTGAVIAGALAGQWSPASSGTATGLVWWTGLVAWGLALACLAGAVYPRIGPGARTGSDSRMVAYFADVARLDGPDDLRAALRRDVAPSEAVLLDQLFRISKIVRIKYRCLHLAFWLLAVGGVCASVTGVLQG
jgi:hypothetical protein